MRARGLGLFGGIVVSVLLGVGCAPPAPVVPLPDLTGAEPVVAEAIEADRKAVIDSPDDAARWGRLGDRYRSQGWPRDAAACYAQSERLDPDVFRWPYLQGKSLRLVDPAAALGGFQRSLERDPAYAPAHLFLAQVQLRLGNVDVAASHFEEAARLDESLAAPWLGLGQLALGAGEYAEALRLLQEALRRDASDGRIHLAASRSAAALGQSADAARFARIAGRSIEPPAIDDPRAALQVEPVGSRQLAEFGKRMMAQRKLPEALAALRESVRLGPDRASPRVALGLALLIAGDTTEAETHLRKATWLSPNLADAHAALGNLLLVTVEGQAEGLEQLEKAVRLRPHEARLRFRLATALRVAGRDTEALAQLQRTLDDANDELAVTLAPDARARLEALVRQIEADLATAGE